MTSDQFRRIWLTFGELVTEHRDELNRLDAAIGDADHGTNLARGLAKVAADLGADGATTHLAGSCRQVGMALLSTVGGASGALWGSALLRAAGALPDSDDCDTTAAVAAARQLTAAMKARGHAELGDKTMMDVWLPALDLLEKGVADGMPGPQAAAAVAEQAAAWAEATAPLVARRGRASYLGARSAGHVDPGSVSTALFWRAVADAVANP